MNDYIKFLNENEEQIRKFDQMTDDELVDWLCTLFGKLHTKNSKKFKELIATVPEVYDL